MHNVSDQEAIVQPGRQFQNAGYFTRRLTGYQENRTFQSGQLVLKVPIGAGRKCIAFGFFNETVWYANML